MLVSRQQAQAGKGMTARQDTGLLRAWSGGDSAALDELIPLVETELRRLGRAYTARERRDHTLQTTAIVNETFIRLMDARRVRWQDRAHFIGIAARLMRRVLVDHARSRNSRLQVSTDTVKRDWRRARLRLLRDLEGSTT